MTRSIDELCKKLGLQFSNKQLIEYALTHRSAGRGNNERLEFLGDSILGFVIAEALYGRFPEADEGILSRLRAGLVNQQSLAALARGLNLGDYLILGSGELRSGGADRDSILSDALEAIMGAIVKDQGPESCRRWILELFAERIDGLSSATSQKDPKTRLQELMQSKGLELPVYMLQAKSGLPHNQNFSVECRVSLASEPHIGTGSSRKKAEQKAAESILAALESSA